ncbi:MAG: hypothetical protein WCO96_07085 [Actinomycetes bacterium]
MSDRKFGLCGRCAHQRLINSGRGSTFSMCGLSRNDPDWPRYPRMPVVACPRFESRGDSPAPVGPRD